MNNIPSGFDPDLFKLENILMSRTQRTSEELLAITRHLNYELAMLQRTAQYLETEQGETPRYYAYLESFCIHARNLMDFCYPSALKDDHVIAHDFFDDPKAWKNIRPKQPKVLKDARARIGACVAHLTYKRIMLTGNAMRWPFQEICREIESVLGRFKSSLPRSRNATDMNPCKDSELQFDSNSFGTMQVSDEQEIKLSFTPVVGITISNVQVLRELPVPRDNNRL